MSTISDVFSAIKEVLLLTNKVELLGETLKEAAVDLKNHERRLTRLETMAEMAQNQQLRIDN